MRRTPVKTERPALGIPRGLKFILAAAAVQLALLAECLAAGGGYTLLPDTHDELKSVVISVNSARRSTLRNADLVGHIVNGLPESTRFLILTNDRPAFTTLGNRWPHRIEFIDLPADNPITMWTQDPFLVLKTPGAEPATTLLTSKTFERSGDSVMAGYVAARAGYRLQTSALYFEGGNVVSDGDFVFIGANTIRYNAIKLNLAEAEVAVRFQDELGRRVLVIGPYPQPIAHIDMMMTPLGDGRILVADSFAGARIAEHAVKNDPQSVTAFERWCEEHFFGHPAIKEIHGRHGEVIEPPEILGKTTGIIERSRAIGPALDGIAQSLEGYGYKVERMPLLDGGPETLDSNDGEPTGVAAYPMLTYNNVLLSESDVYLPAYGWPAMDRAARDRWQALGFQPHAIEGLTISAMYGGALRCSVKVLDR